MSVQIAWSFIADEARDVKWKRSLAREKDFTEGLSLLYMYCVGRLVGERERESEGLDSYIAVQ